MIAYLLDEIGTPGQPHEALRRALVLDQAKACSTLPDGLEQRLQ